MKILSGVYQPDSGRILIAGKPTRLLDSADANRKGIGMVFQEQSLLTNLTVGENIYLGNEAQFTRFGIVDWQRLYAAAARQLAKVKLDVDPRTRADDLDFASRQMVEIAKALTLEEASGGHLVILLDEPTSVLERAEIDVLFARVRALRDRASFIFVSHRLDEVLELSDRIYVMKDGAVVAELATAEADVPTLHHWMVGRSLQAEYYREPLQKPFAPEVLVEAKGLSLGQSYRDVELHAARGRDPRHRRGDRVGARGADPHAGRLRAARRRHADRRRAGGALRHAGRGGGRRHRLHPARAAGRGAGAVPAGGGQHHARRPRQPDAVRASSTRGAERRAGRAAGSSGCGSARPASRRCA